MVHNIVTGLKRQCISEIFYKEIIGTLVFTVKVIFLTPKKLVFEKNFVFFLQTHQAMLGIQNEEVQYFLPSLQYQSSNTVL